MPLAANEIRALFLRFFEARAQRIAPSGSFAQAGGKDPSTIDAAIEKFCEPVGGA